MNNKGQLGTILLVFISVLVGAVLLLPVAQIIGDASNSVQANNVSYTSPAAVSGFVDLAGQELFDTVVVWNTTAPANLMSGASLDNYTFTERVSTTTGVKTISIGTVATADAPHLGLPIQLTYSYGLDGYIDNSGARSVASLITIFMALAVVVVALTPTLRNGFMDAMGR